MFEIVVTFDLRDNQASNKRETNEVREKGQGESLKNLKDGCLYATCEWKC